MDFIKKNDFIVKHKSEKDFEQDLCLYKQHFPESRLHPELKRASSYNKRTLDGYMLNELLDKVSADDILANRKAAAILDNVENAIVVIFDSMKKEASELKDKESDLKAKELQLDDKEAELNLREKQLDDKETELDDKETELIKKAEELTDNVKAQASKKKANTMSSPE